MFLVALISEKLFLNFVKRNIKDMFMYMYLRTC